MWKILLCVCVISSDFVATVATNNNSLFELSIIHMNDFHARFEETTPQSTRCKNTGCVGGFSRLHTAVHALVSNRTNAIFLNAGDNFQGTLWYNLFGWNVTQYFLNKLPTDVYVLGNHEFDQGIEGVTPFIKALNAPTVVANINDTLEPSMKGLYNKSTVLERSGRKIGVIGVILSTTNQISSTGNLSFTDEVEAVKKEADYLVKNKNCSIIIVLSHCGIEVDKKIAEEAGPHVGLVVGGHTHTFLYSGSNPPGPETPRGSYPVVVTNKHGKKVLVVQASYNALYLGNLTVWYDRNGTVQAWDGNPIYLDERIPQDSKINKELKIWKEQVDTYGNTVLGFSQVFLNRSTRRTGESNIGSFFADAMVDYYVDKAETESWTYVSMAIINSGALRTSLFPGNITVYDLVAAQPFGNTLDCGELTGQHIKDFLEYSVTPSAVRKYQFHEFLQVSGIRVVFDTARPVGSRVTSLKLLCNECLTPVYSYVNYTQTYRIIVPSFLANGGDGYVMIRDNLKNRQTGPKDIDVFSEYVRKRSKITQADDERIILLDAARIQDSVEYNSSSSLHVSAAAVAMFVVYVANSLFCFNNWF